MSDSGIWPNIMGFGNDPTRLFLSPVVKSVGMGFDSLHIQVATHLAAPCGWPAQ